MAETPDSLHTLELDDLMRHPAFLDMQERFRQESRTYAAAVSEGFCGTCRGRLEPPLLPDRDGYCPACDVAWRVGPQHEGGGHDWSRESGWYYRERAAAQATSGRYE